MPWKTMDIREQRVQFVVAASRREKSMTALCQEFGISRPVGYEWLRRYQQGGVAAIAERTRRPRSSPRQTAEEVQLRVAELRKQYPDWGARKLKVLLRQQGIDLAQTTIHRILLRHDLIAEQDRRTLALERFERSKPNELWQMDFKGPKLWHQPVGPLSILDDHSRYVIVLQAIGSTRGDLVRQQLETAFSECGVPEAMLMDHGIPWWSQLSPNGATHLSLWLMRQGIRLHWSAYRHPQTQGKVERFHGSLQRALERRRVLVPDIQNWLDRFRWEHNHVRPHEALGMQTPATRWQPSRQAYDPKPRSWEYPTGARLLKVDYHGQVKIQRHGWNIGKAFSGEWVQIVPVGERFQVYYCATLIREIDPGIHRSTLVERWIPTPTSHPKL